MNYSIKILFSFLILITSQLSGYCDTITNWQVYHNGKILVELNEFSEVREITIYKKDFTKGDSIVVKYFRDTPCFDCDSYLSVEDGKHHPITQWKGKGTFTNKVIYLDKLLNTNLSYFEVYYHEGDLTSKNGKALLFRIVLKE